MSWWDVFIIAFIALALWRGYRKGLALRLGGWVGGILMFLILWHNTQAIDRLVSNRINGRQWVAQWLNEYLTHRRQGGNDVFDTSPLRDLINTLPLTAGIESRLMEQVDQLTSVASAHIYDRVSQALAVPVWHLLLFVATWAGALFFLYVFGRLIKYLLVKAPILDTIDRFAGALFSSMLSLIFLALIGGVAHLVGTKEVVTAIDHSFFAEFLHHALLFLLGNPTILT